jgi:hypothetical protein
MFESIVWTFLKSLDFMRLTDYDGLEQELRFYAACDKIILPIL